MNASDRSVKIQQVSVISLKDGGTALAREMEEVMTLSVMEVMTLSVR